MDIAQNQPVNRAFLALNFYISTGDHVGEGVATQTGNKTQIGVPVNTTDATDLRDWLCLEARLEELKKEGFPLQFGTFPASRGPFKIVEIELLTTMLDAFALKLREKPGPLGWGSMKAFLEENGIS